MRRSIVLAMSLFLAACGASRSDRIAIHDQSTSPVNPQLANSMTVGEVTGGSWFFNNRGDITNDQFKGGLEESLRTRSLLAANPATTHYRIDVALDFNHHLTVLGGEGSHVEGTTTYTVTSMTTNQTVLKQAIHSESSHPDVGLFLTSQKDTVDSYNEASANSIAAFLKILETWTPAAR